MIRLRSRLFVALVLACMLIPMGSAGLHSDAVAQADPTPSLASDMPADVVAFISMEYSPTSDQVLQAQDLIAGLLLPRTGDFVTTLTRGFAGLIEEIPADWRSVVEGEVGIGVADVGTLQPQAIVEGSEFDPSAMLVNAFPSYTIVLHPEQAGRARQIVTDAFTSQMEKAGLEPDSTMTDGVLVLRNPDPTTNAIPGVPSIVAFSGDYILFGSNYEAMEPFVATTHGDADSLSDSEDFQQIEDALPAERLLFGYVNGAELTDSVNEMVPGSLNGSMTSVIEAPVGMGAFTISADTAGFRFEYAATMPDSDAASRAGLAVTPGFASQVPDTTQIMYAGRDLGQTWLMDQVQNLILGFLANSMDLGSDLGTPIDPVSQFGFLELITGVNFKTDLIDQLQGNFGMAVLDLNATDPGSTSAVIASELSDSDKVATAVTSLGPILQSAVAGDASLTSVSIDSQTVTDVAIDSHGIQSDVQFGVVDDLLVLGIGDGVETLAAGTTSSLADDPTYRAVLGELPATYDSVLYVNTQSILSDALADANAQIQSSIEAQCSTFMSPIVIFGREMPPIVEAAVAGIQSELCSVLGGLLDPAGTLGQALLTRTPGPLMMVGYTDGDLQRASGILMMTDAA